MSFLSGFGIFGYGFIGYGYHYDEGISSYLSKEYISPEKYGISSGKEVFISFGKLAFGMGNITINSLTKTSPRYNVHQIFSSGYLAVAITPMRFLNFLFIPSVGVGSGKLEINVMESKSGNLDSLLKDPPVNIDLASDGLFLKGSITLTYRYSLILIGINAGAGYVIGRDWKFNGNTITGYPKYKQPAYWISALLGIALMR